MKTVQRSIRFVPRGAVLLGLGVILLAAWLASDSGQQVREGLKTSFLQTLAVPNSVSSIQKVDGIYVLGGTQESLKYKFQTAASVYRAVTQVRILVLGEDGVTEFCSELGRNLTKNEWALKALKVLGVPESDVEILSMEEGFFGTYTEARHVARLARERGYKEILLVCSPYHAYRVKACFQNAFDGEAVHISVQGSGEPTMLRHLVLEWVKARFYDAFLLR